MRSLADGLPPQIARQIHPQWRKNEADYWAVRDQLLPKYRDQWIGFANGTVIVAGKSLVDVSHQAQASGQHPFVVCVGRENEPVRIRRVTFPYDTNYPGEALPIADVEFRSRRGVPGVVLDRVVPDTGADATLLPWSDCQQLRIDPNAGRPGLIGGVAGTASATIAFSIWVHVDGQDYGCLVHVDLVGAERILGRDVLNRLDVLFRGNAREVVFNP
ncbi:MAG: hypothetical protein HYS13_05625 [Planctomycetia bacterium]|nr:hypothetical protein [Planctomycetia bacterium]